jgi:hypothetical protein
MKTSALLKLHQRQVDVLDMIVSCNNRIRQKEQEIANNDNDKFSFLISDYGSWLKDRLKRNIAIKQRLIRYYIDIQERINNLSPKKTSDLEGDLLATKFVS